MHHHSACRYCYGVPLLITGTSGECGSGTLAGWWERLGEFSLHAWPIKIWSQALPFLHFTMGLITVKVTFYSWYKTKQTNSRHNLKMGLNVYF